VARCADRGRRARRKLHKEVVLHTHFNHPNEITAITKRALDGVFERGIITRNQSVLQRGVNDGIATMQLLTSASGLPVQRTTSTSTSGEGRRGPPHHAADRARHREGVRGTTAGFHTPTFVVDAPGRRQARRAQLRDYDRDTGISVFSAPSSSPAFPLLRSGRHAVARHPGAVEDKAKQTR